MVSRAARRRRLGDPEVAQLLDVARDEYELAEPAAEWVAAVGVVERRFALPEPTLSGLPTAPESAVPGRVFLDLVARERGARTLDDRVPLRRRMKALAPALFDAYLHAFA